MLQIKWEHRRAISSNEQNERVFCCMYYLLFRSLPVHESFHFQWKRQLRMICHNIENKRRGKSRINTKQVRIVRVCVCAKIIIIPFPPCSVYYSKRFRCLVWATVRELILYFEREVSSIFIFAAASHCFCVKSTFSDTFQCQHPTHVASLEYHILIVPI